jgi:hypothetical protein
MAARNTDICQQKTIRKISHSLNMKVWFIPPFLSKETFYEEYLRQVLEPILLGDQTN